MNAAKLSALISFTLSLGACSLIADPDEFTYHEGSASDGESDTGEGGESDTTPGSTDDTGNDTGEDTGSDTEDTGTDTGSDEPSTDDGICEGNDDCNDGDICPMLFTNDLFTESESYCYTSCRDDAALCDGTDNPLCYQYETGAVCLERATVKGSFACRVLASTNTSEIELKVRPDADVIRLTRCEIFQDDTGFGFIFSTVLDGAVYEASFYFPDNVLADLQTGTLENASGQIRRNVLNSNMDLTESTVLGIFPPPEIEQEPTLVRDVDILDIQAAQIQGEIEFDGFTYSAKLRI